MLRSIQLAPLFLAAFVGVGLAETVTYNCDMTDLKRGGNWIPRNAVFRVDTDAETVQLLKPTADQIGGYIKGSELVRNDAKKMMVRWTVGGLRSKSNQKATAQKYRASIKKATGEVEVIVSFVGYRNVYRGKGTCTHK